MEMDTTNTTYTYNPLRQIYADGTFTIEVNTVPIKSKDEHGNPIKVYRWALLFFNCGEKFTILSGYCNSIEEASKSAIDFYKKYILNVQDAVNEYFDQVRGDTNGSEV